MRLYKAVITDIPSESKVKFLTAYPEYKGESPEDLGFSTYGEAEELVLDPTWKPAGWHEFIDDRAKFGAGWAIDCQQEEYTFFWPKISDAYKSLSTAKTKARIAERWGATVTIFEAEVSEFVPFEEAKALRKRRRDNERILKLREQIKQIEEARP